MAERMLGVTIQMWQVEATASRVDGLARTRVAPLVRVLDMT